MLNKSAFSVKANANVENTIEFTVKVTGRLNKVTSFNIYIATANATYNKEFPAKYSGQAYVKNALVATNTFDGKIYQEVLKELEAPADKIEKVEIPFETKYLADQSLTAGQRIVEKKVVLGEKTVTTTYTLNSENKFVGKTSEQITKEPETELVRVGTKTEIQEESIPFETIYQEDPQMDPTAAEVIVTPGVPGEKVTSTTYQLNEVTGEITATTTTKTTDPVSQVVKQSPTGEIAFQTQYRENPELTAGETAVKVAGQTGIKHSNGTVTTAPVTEVILVGTKAAVTEETLAPQVIYHQEDATMKKEDPQVVVVEGQAGKKITTVTYTLDETTGKVSANEPVVEITAPIDRVIKVGVGNESTIPYLTKYEADETMTAGETKIKVAGQTGIKHPNGTVTKEPVTEIILVGTKPVVTEEEIAFEVICVDDPTLPAGTVVKVQNGQAGKKIITTTYIVDENTGELTPITTEEVLKSVTELVKRGTKPAEVITTVKEEVKVMPVETPAAPKQEVAKPAQVKAKEVPQTGDTTENTAILGAVGILLTLGLVAYVGRKKRPE